MNRVLVVVAHPDDELLGVGGTIKKRALAGDEVSCLILGEGQTSRATNTNRIGQDSVNKLHSDARKAGDIIGFATMEFLNLPDNRFDRIDLLDIIQNIENYIDRLRPNIIYTHFHGDRNIDHRITFEAVLTACRPQGQYTVKDIYAFETPSSTEWGFYGKNNNFNPNVFEDISETIQYKLEAMTCYTSELKEYPHPRSLKALEIIAQRWGTVVGKGYIEAFELVRSVR